MSEETTSLLLQIVFTLFGGGLVATLINFFLTRPKVRAEAANLVTQGTSTVIKDLSEHNERLTTRAEKAEKVGEELQVTIRDLNDVLWKLVQWVRRVYSLLTPEQKAQAGEPPNTDELFR